MHQPMRAPVIRHEADHQGNHQYDLILRGPWWMRTNGNFMSGVEAMRGLSSGCVVMSVREWLEKGIFERQVGKGYLDVKSDVAVQMIEVVLGNYAVEGVGKKAKRFWWNGDKDTGAAIFDGKVFTIDVRLSLASCTNCDTWRLILDVRIFTSGS